MNKHDKLSMYVKNGGDLFTIDNISSLRNDKQTIIAYANNGWEFCLDNNSKDIRVYFPKKDMINIIEREGLNEYLLFQLERHSEILKYKADITSKIINASEQWFDEFN